MDKKFKASYRLAPLGSGNYIGRHIASDRKTNHKCILKQKKLSFTLFLNYMKYLRTEIK